MFYNGEQRKDIRKLEKMNDLSIQVFEVDEKI